MYEDDYLSAPSSNLEILEQQLRRALTTKRSETVNLYRPYLLQAVGIAFHAIMSWKIENLDNIFKLLSKICDELPTEKTAISVELVCAKDSVGLGLGVAYKKVDEAKIFLSSSGAIPIFRFLATQNRYISAWQIKGRRKKVAGFLNEAWRRGLLLRIGESGRGVRYSITPLGRCGLPPG